MKKIYILVIGFLILMISACSTMPYSGNGILTTQSFPVSGYDRIEVSGSGELVIIQDGSESVVVETDTNLMQYVVARVEGGILHLYLDNRNLSSFRPTRLVFTVHVSNLTAITTSGSWDVTAAKIDTQSLDIVLSGSGQINIDDLRAQHLSLLISGTGELDAAGDVDEEHITVGGSGKIRLGNLRCKMATINISGLSKAVLWATESLTVESSGSSSVQYYGSLQTTINTSGSGEIQHLGDK